MAGIMQKKIGPFTVPVWGAIIGGGIVVGLAARGILGSGGKRDEGEDAPEPVVAVDRDQINYVYPPEEDGTIRAPRAPEPRSGSANPIPPKSSSPIPSPNTGIPNTPPTSASPAGKPSPVLAPKATVSGTQVTVMWSGNDNQHRVVINDSTTNIGHSAFGANEFTFSGQAGRTYKLLLYKQRGTATTGFQTSDAAGPVTVTVAGGASASGASYPGLPSGYRMNCATTSLRHIVSNLSQVDSSGRSSTTKARYLTSWAVLNNGGEPTIPNYAYIWWSGIAQPGIREKVNKVRIANGLYPLTSAEFDAMQADMRRLMPVEYRDERANVFQSLAYANELFNKYNLPFQCGRVIARTERRE